MITFLNKRRTAIILLISVFLLSSFVLFPVAVSGQPKFMQAPPDVSAIYSLSDTHLRINYNNQTIFEGTIVSHGNTFYKDEISTNKDSVINQIFNLTSSNGKTITLTGFISASNEAVPCEADRKDDSFYIVRNSVGLSHSLRNRAVYDRLSDWLLSVDYSSKVSVEPVDESDTTTRFKITISGDEIALRFRPRFYQKHRGLSYFKPWEYKVWEEPITGWCSSMANAWACSTAG